MGTWETFQFQPGLGGDEDTGLLGDHGGYGFLGESYTQSTAWSTEDSDNTGFAGYASQVSQAVSQQNWGLASMQVGQEASAISGYCGSYPANANVGAGFAELAIAVVFGGAAAASATDAIGAMSALLYGGGGAAALGTAFKATQAAISGGMAYIDTVDNGNALAACNDLVAGTMRVISAYDASRNLPYYGPPGGS